MYQSMKVFLISGWVVLCLGSSLSSAHARKTFLDLGIGITSRTLVAEDESLVDSRFRGEAFSTRITAALGWEIWELLVLYLQGGGADLNIDDFDDYHSSFSGSYGAGIRLYLYRSFQTHPLDLFIEGKTLWFKTHDRVQTELCPPIADCLNQPESFLSRTVQEEIDWREYTVLLGASRGTMGSNLYGGLRLSWMLGENRVQAAPDNNFPEPLNLKINLSEEEHLGLFLGMDFPLDRMGMFLLNVELSIYDEDSIRAGLRRIF